MPDATKPKPSPWSDKGLGACARKAELYAIHQADSMYPTRGGAWQRCAQLHFAQEFLRLTKPGGLLA